MGDETGVLVLCDVDGRSRWDCGLCREASTRLWHHLISGLRRPSIDTAAAIAKALGVSLWRLVKEAESS